MQLTSGRAVQKFLGSVSLIMIVICRVIRECGEVMHVVALSRLILLKPRGLCFHESYHFMPSPARISFCSQAFAISACPQDPHVLNHEGVPLSPQLCHQQLLPNARTTPHTLLLWPGERKCEFDRMQNAYIYPRTPEN